MDAAGYSVEINNAGGISLAAKAPGTSATLASEGAINDGQWHHVVAEADRKTAMFTIYIDGKKDAAGPGVPADVSLSNEADLYVAGTPRGDNFAGAIDFMRIARGTLADSKTTIGELYAWEFDGPFLYAILQGGFVLPTAARLEQSTNNRADASKIVQPIENQRLYFAVDW